MNISEPRQLKTVYLLVGAKGSGKTYIGNLAETELGLNFIRVEQRALDHLEYLPLSDRHLARDGYELELEWIKDALTRCDEVVSEATGSSNYLQWFLRQLAGEFELKLIRIVCPLKECSDRVKTRNKLHHYDVSDEKLEAINVASHNVKLDWSLEIHNFGMTSDEDILQAIDALRLERRSQHGGQVAVPATIPMLGRAVGLSDHQVSIAMNSFCLPESIVGPLDPDSLARRERARTADYSYMKFDPAYVEFIKQNHGGIPIKQWFKSKDDRVFRLGRFINFGGPYHPPYQDSWEYPGHDLREDWSHDGLDVIANIVDGCGMFLVPFGILYSREHHPDAMGASYSNMVCFDFKNMNGDVPTVVAWINAKACDEYYAITERGGDAFFEMDHAKISHPVAGSFSDFLDILQYEKPG